MNLIELLAFKVCLSIALPQIIPLNKYNSIQTSDILTVEAGGKLYLASNDNVNLLKKIQITTGTVSTTLDQLQNGTYIKIVDKLTIHSENNAQTTSLLTGFLYVTTAIQANDATFSVTMVNGVQNLKRDGSKSITVVLNTATVDDFPPFDDPGKTTYVTNIEQFSSNSLNFHYGVPDDDWNDFSTNQFFENPQIIPNYDDNGRNLPSTRAFFDTVQPLQINLPYWYITSDGPFGMVLDSRYMDVHTQNVSSENTTGLILVTDVLMQQVVNFKIDPTKDRTTGLLISAFLEYPVNLYLIKTDGISTQGYDSTVKHAQFVSNMAVTQLTVNSTALTPGSFYCQYFGFSGNLTPIASTQSTPSPTTQPITSTTTVATTTKSSRSHDFISLFVLIFVAILRM